MFVETLETVGERTSRKELPVALILSADDGRDLTWGLRSLPQANGYLGPDPRCRAREQPLAVNEAKPGPPRTRWTDAAAETKLTPFSEGQLS